MNREIKFRAWHPGSEKMHTCIEVSPFHVGDCDRLRWNKNDVILMQYTGLKDKNDKEIYEGDIVEGGPYLSKSKTKSHIVYQFNQFKVKDEFIGWEGEGLWYWDEIEVIGNIYENPELL